MNVFLDTNVLLDVLGRRAPHYKAASQVWSLVEAGKLGGYISAISFNNAHYVLRRAEGREAAQVALKVMRDLFRVVPLDEQVLHSAMDSDFSDFEDAIQFFSAVRSGADRIVTRNAQHFPREPIVPLSPRELLAQLSL